MATFSIAAQFNGAGGLSSFLGNPIPIAATFSGQGKLFERTIWSGATRYAGVGTLRVDVLLQKVAVPIVLGSPIITFPEGFQNVKAPRIPPDRYVRRTGDDYAEALAALLPKGPAWPRDPLTTLMTTVRGLAQVLGYADGRAGDLLLRESDPRLTLELLPDWERNWGLPDPCFAGTATTIEQRHNLLMLKMTFMGGQSRQKFEDMAFQLGYHISITEYSPFMCGISWCGQYFEEPTS